MQIVNESETGAAKMYEWYEEVLVEFSKIDASIPVYVSDAWDLGKAVEWSLKRNTSKARVNPVVIDTHLYWLVTAHVHGRENTADICSGASLPKTAASLLNKSPLKSGPNSMKWMAKKVRFSPTEPFKSL